MTTEAPALGHRALPPRPAAPAPHPLPPAGARGRAGAALRPFAELLLAPVALGLAAGRACVRRPSVLAAAAILLVLVPSDNTDVAASVHVTPIDVGTLALVAAVALGALRGERSLPRGALTVLGGVLVALTAATLTSRDPSASLSGLIRYTQLFVVVPAAVAMALRDRRDVLLVAAATLTVAIGEGCVGVYQYLTQTGASYGGAGASSDIRAVGTFGALDVTGMATVVTYGLLAALAIGLCLRGRARVALLAVAAALLAPLVLSLSRGSWIACVCGAGVVLVMTGWRTALHVLAIGAAAGVLVIAVLGASGGGTLGGSATVSQRFSSIFSVTSTPDQSVDDRYDLWQTAASVWKDHPLDGVGLKEFPAFIDTYAPMNLSFYSDASDPSLGYQREPLLSPHNMYLLVASEQGLIGIAAFGGLFAALAVRSLRRTRAAASRGARAAGLAVTAVLAGQLVDFVYADVGGASTVLLSLLLGVAVWWAYHEEPVDFSAPASGPWSGRGWRARAAFAAPPTAPAAVGPRTAPPPAAAAPPPRARAASRDGPAAAARRGGRLRATAITVVLNALGSVLGLGRDLLLAAFFGAGGGSDAFLVAWTVPETAEPLLIDDALAGLFVPAFSRARRGGRRAVHEVITTTLAPMALLLAVLGALVALFAPTLAHALAPGLIDPRLAVTCMRYTSLTVLTIGVAGYLSAALRSHDVFGPPAAIYVAFNIGVLALMLGFHASLGVVSAAVGLAVGGALMVVVQAPSFLRSVGLPRRYALRGSAIGIAAVLPVAVYTLCRQAQVFVERFLSSWLVPGTISHLNYAQKIAQVPMSMSVMLCTVTFPTLAARVHAGQADAVRRVLQRDLAVVGALVLAATAYVFAFAPQIVQVLFQHGAFTAADTAATSSIMRVYSLGLLGQAMVGALSRAFYSRARPTWYPAYAMALGLGATTIMAALLLRTWGAPAIAAANAVGITLTAVLMLFALRREVIDIATGALAKAVGRLVVVAVAATGVGLGLERACAGLPALVTAVLGGVVVPVVFIGLAVAARSPEIAEMATSLRRRAHHAS